MAIMKKILLVIATAVSLFGGNIIEKASCASVDKTTQNIKIYSRKKV